MFCVSLWTENASRHTSGLKHSFSQENREDKEVSGYITIQGLELASLEAKPEMRIHVQVIHWDGTFRKNLEISKAGRVGPLVQGGKNTSYVLSLAVLLVHHLLSSWPLTAMPTTQQALVTSLLYWFKLEMEGISSWKVHFQMSVVSKYNPQPKVQGKFSTRCLWPRFGLGSNQSKSVYEILLLIQLLQS